jgi:hypothetical protein
VYGAAAAQSFRERDATRDAFPAPRQFRGDFWPRRRAVEHLPTAILEPAVRMPSKAFYPTNSYSWCLRGQDRAGATAMQITSMTYQFGITFYHLRITEAITPR